MGSMMVVVMVVGRAKWGRREGKKKGREAGEVHDSTRVTNAGTSETITISIDESPT